MPDNAHIHEDDLELYSAGHLELERVCGSRIASITLFGLPAKT